MFVDALLLSVTIGVGLGMLADVNTNALAGVTTALDFAISKL